MVAYRTMRYAQQLHLHAAAVLVQVLPPAKAPSNGVGSSAQQPGSTSGGATAAAASNSGADSSSPDPFDVNSHFSPTMIVVLVILVSAFLFMGFFAFYVRRCMSDESFRPAHRSSSRRSARGDDTGRQRAGRGVDPSVVDGYPTVSYAAAKRKGCHVCSVCLCDFEKGDDLKQLPKCKHVFHPACVGKWLEANTTCPLCRRGVLSGSDRWSLSWRWGGSAHRSASSVPSTAEGSSRSHGGIEMGTGPQLRRSGSSSYWSRRDGSSSMIWLRWPFGSRGGGNDASSRCGGRPASQQDDTSVSVHVDTRPSCDLDPSTPPIISSAPSSRQGIPVPASPPHAPVAAAAPPVAPSEVATHGLPVIHLSAEVAPGGAEMASQLLRTSMVADARSADVTARGIRDSMPRRCELCRLRSDVVESERHARREGSAVAAVALADVVQGDGKKARALLSRLRLSRSNSTGHSVRLQTAAGCMPFVLYSPRSGLASASRFANQTPRGTSHMSTSVGLATSNAVATSATIPLPEPRL